MVKYNIDDANCGDALHTYITRVYSGQYLDAKYTIWFVLLNHVAPTRQEN